MRDRQLTASHLALSGFSTFDKSVPLNLPSETGDASAAKINVLQDTLHFPLMVLKESALAHNLQAMALWCKANGLLLAPHGKTTMTPRLFERQMANGAWGMTVATASQAMVCAELGIERVIIANQMISRASIATLAALTKRYSQLEIFCLVDSLDGIGILAREWSRAGAERPINVLVEMGHPGWRTGARTPQAALALCAEAQNHHGVLHFRGVEGFEGLAHGTDADEEGRLAMALLNDIASVGGALSGSGAGSDRLILSAGGSAFLDVVWQFAQRVPSNFQIVVRSGCYITHDHGAYNQKLLAMQQRQGKETSQVSLVPRFQPALELWSHVQSKPEEGLAILTFGKRDCAHDIEPPIPLFARKPEDGALLDLAGHAISGLNDQHAYLKGPGIAQLSIGDQVCCGLSHPCTAFDKWRAIPVVDDQYNLLEVYRTYF